MLKAINVTGDPSSLVVGGIHERSAVPLAACTVTVTGRLVLPPGPVHVNVKVLVAVSGPTLSLPVSDFAPDQSAPAVHDVASVDDQVSVLEPFTFMVVGLAAKATVGSGGGDTETVTDWAALPPVPVHVSMNVLLLVSPLRVSLPEVDLLPDQSPDATQELALVDAHDKVVDPL